MSEDYASRAKEIREQFGGDRERAHIELDKLLCEALRDHGEDELADEFEAQGKWYA